MNNICLSLLVSGGVALDTAQALVAQWIEHLTTDQKVGGSSPSRRAETHQEFHDLMGFFFGPRPCVRRKQVLDKSSPANPLGK